MSYKLLVVQLNDNSFSTMYIDAKTVRSYLGGRGLGARLLCDMVPPHADPLGPDNVMLILTGPLTGSLVPGATKHALITKSPATNSYLDCYSSGMVGIQLRYAGYDGMVIKGIAEKPSYISIHNDQVSIRDAAHLWGKDSFTASEMLTREIGGSNLGHAVIGPAGENKVAYACINNDYYRQLGRGGAGAVMGSKRLKAIAVRGTGSLPCTDIDAFRSFHRETMAKAAQSPAVHARKRAGTATTFDVANNAGMLPVHNFQYGQHEAAKGTIDAQGIADHSRGSIACYGCFTPCGKIVQKRSDGLRIEGPEYETLALLGSNLGIADLDFIAEANLVCDRMGLDTISVGNVIGFLMECRQKGLLNGELAACEYAFGSTRGVVELIEDIAHQRGVGPLLSRGVHAAAQYVGGGSEAFAMQTKGLEFPGYDPRRAFGAGLAYAVCPRGACHRRAWPPAKEVLGTYDPYTYEGKAQMVKDQYDDRNILHSLIICDFTTAMIPLTMDDYLRYLRHTVNVEYTHEELRAIADRIESTIRLFNIRAGLTKDHDTLPMRILSEPMPDGPAKGRFITQEGFQAMRSEYYQLRGWDDDGCPTPETVSTYGIEEAAAYEV